MMIYLGRNFLFVRGLLTYCAADAKVGPHLTSSAGISHKESGSWKAEEASPHHWSRFACNFPEIVSTLNQRQIPHRVLF
jgi:hypothetical protein